MIHTLTHSLKEFAGVVFASFHGDIEEESICWVITCLSSQGNRTISDLRCAYRKRWLIHKVSKMNYLHSSPVRVRAEAPQLPS